MAASITVKLEGDGAWPDLDARRADIIHLGNGTNIDLATLEAGMTSGRMSCAFRIDLPDGRIVIAETSWRLLATAVKAIAARHGWPQ
jgi:hypothetical protein